MLKTFLYSTFPNEGENALTLFRIALTRNLYPIQCGGGHVVLLLAKMSCVVINCPHLLIYTTIVI